MKERKYLNLQFQKQNNRGFISEDSSAQIFVISKQKRKKEKEKKKKKEQSYRTPTGPPPATHQRIKEIIKKLWA